jgi:hypothetical protein
MLPKIVLRNLSKITPEIIVIDEKICYPTIITIHRAWDTMRIDVPRAPGLGLMLDENHYERYNSRFGKDGMHEMLGWQAIDDQIESFKTDFILPEMIRGEKEDQSMFEWLKYLPIHTFVPRHFENSVAEKSPLRTALLLVHKNDTEQNAAEDAIEEIGQDDDADEKIEKL